jgi:hypothetical protein
MPIVPILDPGFETPPLASGSYAYVPSGSPWIFLSGAGLTTNGNAFTGGNPPAPQGNQVAFLQGASGSISQVVSFAAGTYTGTLSMSQRGNMVGNNQTIAFCIDGTPVNSFTPVGTDYKSYTTDPFDVTVSGTHTIAFIGLNGVGDNTAFLDQVSLKNTPPDPEVVLLQQILAAQQQSNILLAKLVNGLTAGN